MKKIFYILSIILISTSCRKEIESDNFFRIKFDGQLSASPILDENGNGVVITTLEYSKINSISDTVKDASLGLYYPGEIFIDSATTYNKVITIEDIDYTRPIRIRVVRLESNGGLIQTPINNYKLYKGSEAIGSPSDGFWENGIEY